MPITPATMSSLRFPLPSPYQPDSFFPTLASDIARLLSYGIQSLSAIVSFFTARRFLVMSVFMGRPLLSASS